VEEEEEEALQGKVGLSRISREYAVSERSGGCRRSDWRR
jgi:hypothetical protein